MSGEKSARKSVSNKNQHGYVFPTSFPLRLLFVKTLKGGVDSLTQARPRGNEYTIHGGNMY